jgi:hypothetical protein
MSSDGTSKSNLADERATRPDDIGGITAAIAAPVAEKTRKSLGDG